MPRPGKIGVMGRNGLAKPLAGKQFSKTTPTHPEQETQTGSPGLSRILYLQTHAVSFAIFYPAFTFHSYFF